MPDRHSRPPSAVSERRSVREGWARDYRKRLNALARSILFDEGKPWGEAIREATERLQCRAKTSNRRSLPPRRPKSANGQMRETRGINGRHDGGWPGEA